jgi:hypothetical protein
MKSAVFVLICSFWSFTLFAQGPPIYTETPIMLGLDGGGVRTFGKYVSKENASIYIQPIAVPFNILPKWQIGVIAPFIYKKPEASNGKFGFGDAKFFTKFQIQQKNWKGKTFRTLVKVVETFPTGNTTDSIPLGAGSFQTAVGINSGFITLKYGVYGEVAYNLTSNGLDDNFIYNFAVAIPLLKQQYPPKQINVSLEFNGNLAVQSKSNKLFISPGVQWIVGKRLLFETGIQIPIVEQVVSAEKTKFIYTLGTRFLLF